VGPVSGSPPPSGARVVLGPGGYRLGAIVTTSLVGLVFGGLWLVVLVDALGGGSGGTRLLVMSALGLGLPLLTWLGLSAMIRRARRAFDTVDTRDPARVVLTHSFTGARVELGRDEIEAWILVEAPPARAGEMGTRWLELRRRGGVPLASEPHAIPDRLLRGLEALGVRAHRERAGASGGGPTAR